jgi:hypothetical protein
MEIGTRPMFIHFYIFKVFARIGIVMIREGFCARENSERITFHECVSSQIMNFVLGRCTIVSPIDNNRYLWYSCDIYL